MDRLSEQSAADLAGEYAQSCPEYTPSRPVLPECQNCRKDTVQLYWVPGFEFWGCAACRDEAETQESTCPHLAAAIDKAKSVVEVQWAMRSHEISCTECASTRKTVADDRLYLQKKDAVCCTDRKKEVA